MLATSSMIEETEAGKMIIEVLRNHLTISYCHVCSS
jgi:hypothetical protein